MSKYDDRFFDYADEGAARSAAVLVPAVFRGRLPTRSSTSVAGADPGYRHGRRVDAGRSAGSTAIMSIAAISASFKANSEPSICREGST